MSESEMSGEELTRRRDYIDELGRRLQRGDITQEFYDAAWKQQVEIEKKYGLLKPGSWLWDSMLDDLNDYNLKKSQQVQDNGLNQAGF